MDFDENSSAIYYVQEYFYNKEKGEFKKGKIRNVVTQVNGVVSVNGTDLYNVTTTDFYIYLGVNYTTFTELLLDDLGRPHSCEMKRFIEGRLNSTGRAPRGSAGSRLHRSQRRTKERESDRLRQPDQGRFHHGFRRYDRDGR